ncbi:MAG: hypothetical protein WA885_07040 [Phormidesmis sp.]
MITRKEILASLGLSIGAIALTPFSTSAETLINATCYLDTGSGYEVFSFDGAAGDYVAITMTSSEFDPYIQLLDDEGNLLGENSSSLYVALPYSGFYDVVADSYSSGGKGMYSLTVVNEVDSRSHYAYRPTPCD